MELNWLLFLNILSFNFVQTPNKSLRVRKFRRSNVHRSDVVQTNHCQSCTTFLLDVLCSKWPYSFFCGSLSPMLVHLHNLFLMNTPVAPRWVSRRKDVKELFITIGGKHFISRRTMFSPNPHLVEGETYFPFFHLDMVWNELNSHKPPEVPKCYITLDLTCCVFVAYCHDLPNKKS